MLETEISPSVQTGNFWSGPTTFYIFLTDLRTGNFSSWVLNTAKVICRWSSLIKYTMYIRSSLDSSPPEQNDCHFADDIFKCNFVIEKLYILIKISLKLVPKGLADQIHWRIYAALGGDELTSFCTHNVGCPFSHDLSPSNTISVPGLGVRPGTISDHGLGVRRNSSSRRVGAVASKDFTRFKNSVPLASTFAPTGNVKVGASSRLKKQSMDEPATSKDIDLQSLNSCHAELFLKQHNIYLHFQ